MKAIAFKGIVYVPGSSLWPFGYTADKLIFSTALARSAVVTVESQAKRPGCCEGCCLWQLL